MKTARADEYNKKTIFTFNQPVEIPGFKAPHVLPAGTYEFKLLDSAGDRNIVQVFNKEGTHLYATILAIPDYRMQPTDGTVIKFKERAAGAPDAVKAWFYPGDNFGQEFVYPKAEAMELAESSGERVLSMPDTTSANITKPASNAKAASVTAMVKAPVKAEQPNGGESEVAEANIPPAPGDSATAQTTQTTNNAKTLPKTASNLPLLALSGMLMAGFGLGLRLFA
ncbi:MAG: hypothetical protein ACREIC_17985, partial [Limisphaerales bacterium]